MSAVRRFLDLSTGHLPASDRSLIADAIERDGGNATLPSSAHVGRYGWFLYVGDAPKFARWTGSPTLQAIFEHALAEGCDYVLLDADGPVDEALPWFDED